MQTDEAATPTRHSDVTEAAETTSCEAMDTTPLTRALAWPWHRHARGRLTAAEPGVLLSNRQD
uniref:Uncharacterized protein n=1 Tax=Setaria viridis TaxID=4556 RepID=A0A4U6WAC8_SETVI|nr:hypothetical protein SEVIR_1G077350v2 [Setaria viridis]